MQLKCIAIDDEPLALELIKNYVARIPALQLLHTFDDALSGAEFLKTGAVDLLFVDINMPDITGVELVRALEKKPMVIFTTAYKNYAFEGFELEALDYLLKPIDFNRFSKAVEKAIDYYKYKNSTVADENAASLYVYSEYRMVRIDLKDIEYIESMEDYIKIHRHNLPTILTLMPLKKILEKLPADGFQRVHRSYIVAINKVKAVQNRKAYIGDMQIPISDTYFDVIKNWLKK
ncbi:MAG: LytTR family DNA-binding domain-containing protein [Mucilaginibacter sp.]